MHHYVMMLRMQKSILYVILAFFVIVAGYYLYKSQENAPKSFKDATYIIDNKQVTLVDGYAEEAIPDSSAKVSTRYFGNEVRKDINGDGNDDVVFLLTQSTGGSGTFFYVVAALGDGKGGYTGSHAYLLGDRIAPQTTGMGEEPNSIIVNYADRAEGEPMSARPSVGKSAHLLFDPASNSFIKKGAQ